MLVPSGHGSTCPAPWRNIPLQNVGRKSKPGVSEATDRAVPEHQDGETQSQQEGIVRGVPLGHPVPKREGVCGGLRVSAAVSGPCSLQVFFELLPGVWLGGRGLGSGLDLGCSRQDKCGAFVLSQKHTTKRYLLARMISNSLSSVTYKEDVMKER